jgi:hypothetical protein
VHDVRGAARRPLVPQQRDKIRDADRPARPREKQSQDQTLLAGTGIDRLPATPHLHRPQHGEAHVLRPGHESGPHQRRRSMITGHSLGEPDGE